MDRPTRERGRALRAASRWRGLGSAALILTLLLSTLTLIVMPANATVGQVNILHLSDAGAASVTTSFVNGTQYYVAYWIPNATYAGNYDLVVQRTTDGANFIRSVISTNDSHVPNRVDGSAAPRGDYNPMHKSMRSIVVASHGSNDVTVVTLQQNATYDGTSHLDVIQAHVSSDGGITWTDYNWTSTDSVRSSSGYGEMAGGIHFDYYGDGAGILSWFHIPNQPSQRTVEIKHAALNNNLFGGVTSFTGCNTNCLSYGYDLHMYNATKGILVASLYGESDQDLHLQVRTTNDGWATNTLKQDNKSVTCSNLVPGLYQHFDDHLGPILGTDSVAALAVHDYGAGSGCAYEWSWYTIRANASGPQTHSNRSELSASTIGQTVGFAAQDQDYWTYAYVDTSTGTLVAGTLSGGGTPAQNNIATVSSDAWPVSVSLVGNTYVVGYADTQGPALAFMADPALPQVASSYISRTVPGSSWVDMDTSPYPSPLGSVGVIGQGGRIWRFGENLNIQANFSGDTGNGQTCNNQGAGFQKHVAMRQDGGTARFAYPGYVSGGFTLVCTTDPYGGSLSILNVENCQAVNITDMSMYNLTEVAWVSSPSSCDSNEQVGMSNMVAVSSRWSYDFTGARYAATNYYPHIIVPTPRNACFAGVNGIVCRQNTDGSVAAQLLGVNATGIGYYQDVYDVQGQTIYDRYGTNLSVRRTYDLGYTPVPGTLHVSLDGNFLSIIATDNTTYLYNISGTRNGQPIMYSAELPAIDGIVEAKISPYQDRYVYAITNDTIYRYDVSAFSAPTVSYGSSTGSSTGTGTAGGNGTGYVGGSSPSSGFFAFQALASAMGITVSAAAGFLAVVFILAVFAGGYYVAGSMGGAIGASLGVLGAYYLGMIPLWVVYIEGLVAIGVTVVGFGGVGQYRSR